MHGPWRGVDGVAVWGWGRGAATATPRRGHVIVCNGRDCTRIPGIDRGSDGGDNPGVATHRIEIETRPDLDDPLAAQTLRRCVEWLHVTPSRVRTRKVFSFDLRAGERELSAADASAVLAAILDPVAEVGALGRLSDATTTTTAPEHAWAVEVGFKPGVTDAVARSVAVLVADTLGEPVDGLVASSTVYFIEGLDRGTLDRVTAEILHNPLIQTVDVQAVPRASTPDLPRPGVAMAPAVASVALRELDDAALLAVSEKGTLALSLTEMRAIQSHYRELGRDPTDAELECLAQTWSEHCKHKIFASPIAYVGPDGDARTIQRGLFRTYIRGVTETIGEQRKASGLDDDGAFLVSVFHDNAGVVRFTDADHLVYKVETHNSPSALDPYGGAMTGIVGVNRDSFGTGLGADLLTNVYGYCLGDPAFEGRLPRGLMHPRRIREGVHHGVIDGGNHSGVPLSRGWELFDDRYVGKPLVYCGTVAVMPVTTAGRPTHEKVIAAGDAIVMIGGRVGKDGIHGATFSSRELDESAPVQAVQIGDPIVQRKMFDMLAEARDRGLYSGLTDNGAGGLSSSVGELATHTGGARIDLARAPLKYPGLAPWEILVSEAQERMTVAVPPADLDAFLELAARREVEATVLGEFTRDGRLVVTHGEQVVADLDLEFLHDGVPLPTLSARWSPTSRESWGVAQLRDAAPSLFAAWTDLFARPGLACTEARVRGYDHEVKGLSVVKPLVGVHGDVPATATVMRARHGRDEGVVLAEGVHPFYGDVDTHAMAVACVDEAVRRLLCAGARIDRISALDNFCWPDPIVSAKTPDGEHKLAQLVRCCEGLHHACLGYGVPLISGKDSMKNDAVLDGVKISIPPTLLVSAMGQIDDVKRALDLVPEPGQRIGLIGRTASEFGGSEIVRALGGFADSVPRTDVAESMEAYRAFAFLRDAGLVRSAHVVARGGLAVALGQMALASDLDVEVDLDAAHLDPWVASFSESTGRILFTYDPADEDAVTQALAGVRWCPLGSCSEVSAGETPILRARHGGGAAVVEIPVPLLRERFRGGLA